MSSSETKNSSKGKTASIIERKIDAITTGGSPYYNSIFKQMVSSNQGNAEILYEFLIAEQNEKNIKLSTKLADIKVIFSFNRYLNYKNFKEITKPDIFEYLNSLRKPELEDPTHKWIGTYNTRYIVLAKFFRWIYNKDEHDKEKWIAPECLQGIKQLHRKEKSPYTPSDIWTDEEHNLFLKYCPEKRDRCYHAMANDTSCRPHELLSLRIKDIKFKMSSTGNQYAEVHITESKTKPRTLPLIFSVPHVKEWIDSHPMTNNPDSFLFISLADINFGKQLSENALYKQYTRSYKQKYFPKLLADKSIPERDKACMRYLLTKPFAPYIQRHSALTQKSQILKESMLRDHAGWSMTSKMPNVYIHYFGNESAKSLLEAYGIEKREEKQTELLKPRSCPNCNELNKQDSRFCSKCRMVLVYDAYNEIAEEKEKEGEKLKVLENEMSTMKSQFTALIDILSKINDKDLFYNSAKMLFDSGILSKMNI